MQAEVTDLLEENGRVAGVRAKTATDTLEVRAISPSAPTAVIRWCASAPASP